MNYNTMLKSLIVINILLLVIIALPTFVSGQDAHPSQSAGVENTKTGMYRALAQLSYQAFEKGDSASAAELARILEETWDKGEEQGGKAALFNTNRDLFWKIDAAMDKFIKPILQFTYDSESGRSSKKPDLKSVHIALDAYLRELRLAEK